MKMKSLVLSILVVLLCQSFVFGVEEEIVDLTTDSITNVENTENIVVEEMKDPYMVTYREAVEGIVKTLNKRDSYFFEIVNPNDYIQYVKNLGIEIPEDTEKDITRLEFVKLLVTLTEKVANDNSYSTNLIEIGNVFKDIEGLTEEELNNITIVFIEGLMDGKKDNKFAPNETLNETELKFVLERLLNGYSREKLFSIVNSCFTNAERDEVLVKYGFILEENSVEENNEILNDTDNVIDTEGTSVSIEVEEGQVFEFVDRTFTKGELVDLLVKLEEKVVFETTDLTSFVKVRDIIDYFNVLWKTPGVVFNKDAQNNYHYLANDTSFLSNEEWEYLNTHLDSEITFSDFLILYDRVKNLEKDMLELGYFDDWEKILKYSKNYLGFVYPMIETNKDCFNYFLDLNEISQNSKIKPTDFARTIHECQHEEFLTMSKASFSRKKSAGPWGTWSINPYKDPKIFHYLDYTKTYWADSEMNSELPVTNLMYEHYPDYIKEDSKIVHYGTGEDSSSNALGIQGLLSEFCSFAVETKVQAVSFSLGMNNATFGSLDYDSYRKMELMVKDYILYLRDTNTELYNTFMSDTDTIRMINNIVKDMDYVESLYPWSMKYHTDVKLLDWETELMSKIS